MPKTHLSFRPARVDESQTLSDLAFRSKAHWGYDATFMQQCRASLTVPAKACDAGLVGVMEVGGEVGGFYRLGGTVPNGDLEDLFIDEPYIGQGLGKRLWLAALRQARELGYHQLELHADPHAEGFYLHMGARTVGQVESSAIPGRMVPRMLVRV